MLKFVTIWITTLFMIFGASETLAQTVAVPSVQGLPPFPQPRFIIQDDKKFNAVAFGPGNTFTIQQTPPDFSLDSVALSSDGKKVAIGWGSGRVEIRDVASRKKLAEFKARDQDLIFAHNDEWLITTGSGGKVRVSDIATCKTVKELEARLGKRNYDVRGVIYLPEADYWAYVDGEEGRVVRLSDGHILASLGDATDFALSADGKRLWTVGRSGVALFSAIDWTLTKEWPLRQPTNPTSEPELTLGRTDDGSDFVAVPSINGLTLYSETPRQKSDLESGRSFIDSTNHLVLVAGRAESLYDMKWNLLCRWQQRASHRFASSADGQWFALADFDKVSIWRMQDLEAGCTKP
jgi:WD40 repeat protein